MTRPPNVEQDRFSIRRFTALIFVLIISASVFGSENNHEVLEGILKVHPKYLYKYYITGFGDGQECALMKCKELEKIKPGSYIHVEGRLGTFHHSGGTKNNPSPFSKTWIIYMDVEKVNVLKPPREQLDYLWNINDSGFFDGSNKDYTIKNNCVTVDLRNDVVLCPTGLGHLVSGRESVKEICFKFINPIENDCWLHISWEPGGSGKEQFEVFCNSAEGIKSYLADAKQKPNQTITEKFKVKPNQGDNDIIIQHLSGDGLRFKYIFLSTSDREPLTPLLNPNLKFPMLKAYEAECKEPGIMLDDTRLRLFAPKRKAREAKIVFRYLVKAYDELYSIVGSHPEYKLVIYHFPENNEHGWGGTSNCTIWYSYKNLEFESQKEWTQYKVPHLSGYIEEMAHNFDGATSAQFGWEMIGWNLGIKATKKVAGNPILTEQVNQTRLVQRETFQRYIKNDYTFSKDLLGNLCDRIHAYVLWMCEQRYGHDFWEDFFREIQKERKNFESAKYLKDPDKIRNRKYQITVECFDRLPKVEFRKLLDKYHLSQTTAIKSLRPTEPNWDRKFLGFDSISVDIEQLPPLHKAAYEGHYQTTSQLIEDGFNVNEKGPNGWTALHMAAIGGHRMLSELLLNKGADTIAVDKEGRTPIDLAKICGHNGLAEFLESKE